MSEDTSDETPSNDTTNANDESNKNTNSNPPSEKASTPSVVKVDLTELREIIDALPEKTAQFIKEAVQKPKQTATKSETPKTTEKAENAPTDTSNNGPKRSAGSKRGWLARALYGN